MSAVLREIRPSISHIELDGTSFHPRDSLTSTAPGLLEPPQTANLRESSPAQWKPVEPAVRRRTFEVPEVDISSSWKRSKQDETASASVETHRVASQLLAEWHGQVLEIGADSFTAQLKGRHGNGVSGMEEEAVIPLEDVRDSDKELLAPGAFFSLCISYEINASGSKRRFAEVIFRRMPSYRREELEAARVRAREIVRGLRLE